MQARWPSAGAQVRRCAGAQVVQVRRRYRGGTNVSSVTVIGQVREQPRAHCSLQVPASELQGAPH